MNLNEEPIWEEGIYQLETTDLVLGGPDGISNQQAKQLANRTLFLYQHRSVARNETIAIAGGTTVVAASTLTASMVNLNASATGTLQLDGAADLEDGAIMRFSVYGSPGSPVNVRLVPPVGMVFATMSASDDMATSIYLHQGESIAIQKRDVSLQVISHQSQLFSVGEIIHSYAPPHGATIGANGQLINRADAPRLWQLVKDVAMSEADYLLNPGARSGNFTTGNGTTTFRVPDLRGVFIRGFDAGRGLDPDRPNTPLFHGSLQMDEIKSHSHAIPNGDMFPSSPGPNDKLLNTEFKSTGSGSAKHTASWGANETRPKNVAYRTYIRI